MRHREIAEFGAGLDTIAALEIHPDLVMMHKLGQNIGISSVSAPEDVWDLGGDWVPLLSAIPMEVVSDSADDDVGGIGAREIHVYGLDNDWYWTHETVVVTGLVPVVLEHEYLRVYRMNVEQVGTSRENVGNIVVRPEGGGTPLAQIAAGKGQSLMAIYSIPNGWTGVIRQLEININGDATTTVAASVVLLADNHELHQGWRTLHTAQVVSDGGSYLRAWSGGIRFSQKTDVKIRVLDITGNNRSISAQFDVLMFRNDQIGNPGVFRTTEL